VSACPRDGEPLDAVTVATPKAASDALDDETVVRPKRAQPIGAPRFTEVRLAPPDPPAASVDAVRRTEVPDRIIRERSHWPIILGLGAVLAAAVAVIAYYAVSGQADLAREIGAEITEARVAVAEARARLESLPPESPLRAQLLSLQQWERELQQLELGERTSSTAMRARAIASEAREISDEARAAGGAPAAPATLPAPATNTSPTPTDPMAVPPADAEPEPVEPPDPGTAPPPTLPPGTSPETKAPPSTNTVPPPEKSSKPPAKVDPPPPPPPETSAPGR
jgi:hypothetical protein